MLPSKVWPNLGLVYVGSDLSVASFNLSISFSKGDLGVDGDRLSSVIKHQPWFLDLSIVGKRGTCENGF